MNVCTIESLHPFARISKFSMLLITSQGSVAARSLSDLRNNLETSLLKGISWHAAHRCAGEPNRPQDVHYLWTKMMDLLSYLHTGNMSGSPFQTALGYPIAIHPKKSPELDASCINTAKQLMSDFCKCCNGTGIVKALLVNYHLI